METEISNLPDKEVREMVIGILTNLGSGIAELSTSTELEPSRTEEYNNSENTLEGISSRLADRRTDQ